MSTDGTAAIRARLIAAMQQRAAGLQGEARHALDRRLAELRRREPAPAAAACGADGRPAQASALRALLERRAGDASSTADTFPELSALGQFRALWSSLRADSQLRQAVAHVPADAGPLNSTALATRAIARMGEVSPGYLRGFLAYVDNLAWLEAAASGTPGGVAAKPRARRKPG